VPPVVTSAKRLSALPDVPTMIEAGYPAVEALSWGGLFAPERTPQPIVKRLSDELGLVMKSAEVKAALDTVASFPTDMPHEAFAPYVAREAGKWGGRRPQVGRESGVTAQDRKARVHVRRHLKGDHKGPVSAPPMRVRAKVLGLWDFVTVPAAPANRETSTSQHSSTTHGQGLRGTKSQRLPRDHSRRQLLRRGSQGVRARAQV